MAFRRRQWIQRSTETADGLDRWIWYLLGAGAWGGKHWALGMAVGAWLFRAALLKMVSRWRWEEDAEVIGRAVARAERRP